MFADHSDSTLLLEIYCLTGASAQAAEQACEALRQLFSKIEGVVAFEQPRAGQLAEPKKLGSAGDDSFRYEVGELGYRVSAGAFFQVNRFLSHVLVKTELRQRQVRLLSTSTPVVGSSRRSLRRVFHK